MHTIEFRLTPVQFRLLLSGLAAAPHALFTSASPVDVGHHALFQEFDGPTFTGRWIRTRVVHVDASPAGHVLTLKLIAKNSAAPVRRRAA